MAQYLRKLRGSRSGVAGALLAILLIVSGCGGGGSKTSNVTPTPTFTPAAGSYTSAQNVTVSDTNQGAVLYCSNDGSMPTASSAKCANPITVSQSQTINAIAVAPGLSASGMATAAYTIAGSVAAPTITGIGPANGPSLGGTSVTIVGINFTGATSVNFGTSPATSFTVNSSTSITAVSPAGVGTVNVTVVTAGGTSATGSADLFTYAIASTPVITALTPNAGVVGSSVAIIGTNFGSSQGSSTVSFNGTFASVASTWTPTGIIVTVPTGATSGNVVVTVGGVPSAGVAFAVTAPAPAISQLSPSSGAVGSTVVVIGSNFGSSQGSSSVTFNGTVATAIASWSSTAIVVTVPANATTGSVNVNVNGVESNGEPFTVQASGGPTISGLSENAGSVGDSVTINGSNFGASQGSSSVTFNGTAATATSWSDTQIMATVPAAATTGNVVVTVNGAASNGEPFTVNAPPAPLTGVVISGPASGGTPIGNATVQLYAAGTSGYGAGAAPIGSAVMSDPTTGAFSGILYACSALTAPGDQLYVTATGNTGVVLMAALGSCGALSPTGTSVTINEATTIASAYALSGFASINSSGGITIGAPTGGTSCNAAAGWKSNGPSTCNYIGLSNAFATVNNLVNVTTGTAFSTTPWYASNNVAGFITSQVPQTRINALASVLAVCANPITADCSSLFTASTVGSTVPADILQATLDIAQNPGNNASQIASLIPATPAYGPSLTSTQTKALTDWAMAIVYVGGGLSSNNGQVTPTGAAIDATGNVWVTAEDSFTLPSGSGTNTGGMVAVFNNLGVPISTSGSSPSSLGGYSTNVSNPQAIAIDQNGYAWIGNYAPSGSTGGSITVLDFNGNPQYGSTPYSNQLMMTPNPYGIAVDANNNVWISSSNGTGAPNCSNGNGPFGGSILGLVGSGSGISTNSVVADYYSDGSSCPTTLSIDPQGNLWTYDFGGFSGDDTNNSYSLLVYSSSDGSLVGGPYNNQYAEIGPLPMMFDSVGNGWFTTYNGGFNAGVNRMLSIDGVTDTSVLEPGGALSGSPASQYDPINFTPADAKFLGGYSPVAIDGSGRAWFVTPTSNIVPGLFGNRWKGHPGSFSSKRLYRIR